MEQNGRQITLLDGHDQHVIISSRCSTLFPTVIALAIKCCLVVVKDDEG